MNVKVVSSCTLYLFLISTLLLVLVEQAMAGPPLKNGQKWVVSPNCAKGGVYKTTGNTIQCHCWGRQGYICEPAGKRKPSGGRPNNNNNGGGGSKCPPTATVCVINNNSNTNSNSNQNSNQNKNQKENGDYDNY